MCNTFPFYSGLLHNTYILLPVKPHSFAVRLSPNQFVILISRRLFLYHNSNLHVTSWFINKVRQTHDVSNIPAGGSRPKIDSYQPPLHVSWHRVYARSSASVRFRTPVLPRGTHYQLISTTKPTQQLSGNFRRHIILIWLLNHFNNHPPAGCTR